MNRTLEEVERQLERILTKLGIDKDEIKQENKSANNNISPVNINFAPTMNQSQYQHQSTEINVHIEVGKLAKEFENEVNNIIPNKSKLKSIIEKIRGYGKDYAPVIVDLVVRYWDKIAGIF